MAPTWAATAVPLLSPFLLSSAPSARCRPPELHSRKRAGGGATRPRPRRQLLPCRNGFAPPAAKASAQELGERALAAGNAGEEPSEEVSTATLIWRAIKLPIYSVAFVPLTVGSSAAYLKAGFFSSMRYLALLSASILVITWLNLSNDVYDFDTGADRNKKESVVNIVGSREVTHFAANISLALGSMGLIWACAESGDIRSILLLALAILCGYLYQCPPFRLGYLGLGEPLCFAAFGPFATTAFYFSQGSKSLSGAILSASILVGLTTTLILFCSHFHQIEGDRAVGKLSPLVRIGTRKGSIVVKVAILTLYALLFSFCMGRALPVTCAFACILTLPIAKLIFNYVEENHEDKVRIFMAKYYCVRLHSLFGICLALGLVLARMGANVRLPSLSVA
uniref:1,4-dihydroxy-2-naphthoate polyprenyltransferase, chloroplastic n=1 Tax=Anthurium amnicola TaxID=1678845 RepID=A0A1D1Y9L9_9ARAE